MSFVHIVAVSQSGEAAFINNVCESGSGVYLHDSLEDKNGYDICQFLSGSKPNEKGVYDAIVYMNDGTFINAVLYYWLYNGNSRGLVVAVSDKKDTHSYAIKKYQHESSNL